jgi:helicase SWR1
MRLLDQDDEPVPDNKRNTRHERKIPTGPPPRQTDFQDSLMAHMVQVRNAMMAEAKIKPVVCKKIARMVQVYWEHIHTKDERARVAEERERKRKAKEVVKALKKRWGLAIKVSKAKATVANGVRLSEPKSAKRRRWSRTVWARNIFRICCSGVLGCSKASAT